MRVAKKRRKKENTRRCERRRASLTKLGTRQECAPLVPRVITMINATNGPFQRGKVSRSIHGFKKNIYKTKKKLNKKRRKGGGK